MTTTPLSFPPGLRLRARSKARPDVVLHAGDKRHPSVAGTYLAAATVYAALFKTSPVGLEYTAGLDRADREAVADSGMGNRAGLFPNDAGGHEIAIAFAPHFSSTPAARPD